MKLLDLFFVPPLAVARLGGAAVPLESFSWGTEPTIHGAHQTVVQPQITLDVRPDGSVLPYLPNAIEFRDGTELRPVAPFFELWAETRDGNKVCSGPLNLKRLEELQISTAHITFSITVANRKAQRRTGSAACAFIARASSHGADHVRKRLLAVSPHTAEATPLVAADRPIPLGFFQVIRPLNATLSGVDLSVVRVRFTPAAGEVYGPPSAEFGPASPLPPGGALHASTLGGRLHEIVPKANRILNAGTAWSEYVMDTATQEDPQPSDSYDGANVGDNRSWGIVDDTCDGVIEANVVAGGQRFVAFARVVVGCPDYAPDRRPFYSLADDLADRDLDPVEANDLLSTEAELVDLFQRVFETVSLVNLDSTRIHGIEENIADPMPENPPGVVLPKLDERSMTKDDVPFVNLVAGVLNSGNGADDGPGPSSRLAYSDIARQAHAPLTDVETLLGFLQSQREHVMRLLRPPYGRFREFEAEPGPVPNDRFRDPRVQRDALQDMRMPPYMRDSDQTTLSITYRQYGLVMSYLERFRTARLLTVRADVPRGVARESPLGRRITELAQHIRASSAKPTDSEK
jgi:hypothetical protein